MWHFILEGKWEGKSQQIIVKKTGKKSIWSQKTEKAANYMKQIY